MRLLPYWPKTTYNGSMETTISNLEDEVLDLCKSPLYAAEVASLDIEMDTCAEKQQRPSLHDFKQSDKKSLTTNGGYKSLIKQAKPKTYLCLSRKAEKRRRFGKLQLTKLNGRWYKSSQKHGNKRIILSRQNVQLNEQQKKLLRLRRIKFIAQEQRKREESKRLDNQVDNVAIETNKEVPNSTNDKKIEDKVTTTTCTSTENGHFTTNASKPRTRKRKNNLPLHVLETIDAVARGYFSEPETPYKSAIEVNATSNTQTGRNQKKKMKDLVMQKRSKSETKRPLNHRNELIGKNDLLPNLHVSLKRKSANSLWQSVATNNTAEEENLLNNFKKSNKTKKCLATKIKSKNKCMKSKENISTTTLVTLPTTSNTNVENSNMEMVVDDDDKRETNNNHVNYETNNKDIPTTTEIIHVNEDIEIEQQQSEHKQPEQHNFDKEEEDDELQHSEDVQKFLQPTLPLMTRIACHQHHHVSTKRSRSRSKFGCRKRTKQKHSTVLFELDDTLPPVTRGDVVPKWNNGWTWEGEPFQGAVFLNVNMKFVKFFI